VICFYFDGEPTSPTFRLYVCGTVRPLTAGAQGNRVCIILSTDHDIYKAKDRTLWRLTAKLDDVELIP